jgi:ParB family transcriptional regulator, chromosome partitioning protein
MDTENRPEQPNPPAVVTKLVMVETRQIKPYHRNARKNDATVERLVKLIPKVGFNVPLVLDKNNVIVKGHTRWKAAIRLAIPALPCVYTEADEETIKLDRIADNKVQEFSQWDEDLLRTELASINLDFNLTELDLALALKELSAAPSPGAPPASASEATGERAGEGTGDPFITEADIRATASLPTSQFTEVTCSKCGNHMFIRK